MSYQVGDIIPGLCRVPTEVYEVQEGVCSMCGEKGFVLAGLHLEFSKDESQRAFMQKYQAQKPVVCQNPDCRLVYCQPCAIKRCRTGCLACKGSLNFL
jgi:hypothetical protein